MMNPEESYKYDATFHSVVDLMRAHLSVYEITPSELRQAAMLAATMHESQRVKPLFTRSYFPAKPWEVFVDEAKDIPPAMFGGEQIDKSKWGVGMVGAPIGSLLTEQDKQAGLDKFTCICGAEKLGPGAPNRQKHTHTCNDRNWAYYHPKPEHCHYFVGPSGRGYSVCADCGMSDVYYNWAYNEKS